MPTKQKKKKVTKPKKKLTFEDLEKQNAEMYHNIKKDVMVTIGQYAKQRPLSTVALIGILEDIKADILRHMGGHSHVQVIEEEKIEDGGLNYVG